MTTLEYASILETTTLPQGQGALCQNGAYCCLGVGAFTAKFQSRAGLEGVIEFYCPETQEWNADSVRSFVSDLPDEMKGGPNSILVMYHGEWEDVTDLNDVFGFSFKRIGQLIRSTVARLEAAKK